VLSLRGMLEATGTDISAERLAVLGAGSIGVSALRLLLNLGQHPAELLLCDIYERRAELAQLRDELVTQHGFNGKVQLIGSRGQAPEEIYRASLIIGATNVGNVLDVDALLPGTKIVDDSAPHCFDVQKAITRLERQGDILFTEGGLLRASSRIDEVRYIPHPDLKPNPFRALHVFARAEDEIMGCVLSGLLAHRFPQARPTLGLMDLSTCRHELSRLTQLGFRSARLSCLNYFLPAEAIRAFGERFGQSNARAGRDILEAKS
jgi:hypothetical protein